ncbi:hypothetical protein PSI9734_00534 [Pseudidiomarina piscicola]|uniref:DUF3466 family protein n=1 Tax=Pseudidiomarina piscicola TaxID=2614830 RepID=A0A6S6WML6_9GAMM|nr:DUF3466 family protein [Pseudidiomarina piscicola]CAB0149963.1 hypothetical protein PSI9734_00534 [Pseudidiomarina piscicola]VZT39409.1 hypothetical protein PSI9734_00534 [Pseudomonas aeruginosa]
MKKLTLGMLSAAVASSFLSTAQADVFTFQKLETPEQVRHLFPTDINDNRHLTVIGQIPNDLDIDLTRLQASTLASIGISPDEEDLENYSLSYAQYYALVQILRDGVSPQLRNPRVSFYFAGYFDGQTTSLNQFFNDTDPETPELENTSDHFFYALNNNNARVGWGTAPYRYESFSYTTSGDDPETITYEGAERDFTRQAIWSDGSQTKTYAAPEQAYLGGESAMMDINDQNIAVGFASTALSPSAVEVAAQCETAIEEETAVRSVYGCMWQRWFTLRNSTATNLQSYYDRTTIATNQSIYDMQAAVWQLDQGGEVIDVTYYPPLMERGEEDEADLSSYAYAVNNNGIAVGQSWTYYEGTAEPNRRIKMPAIFHDGQTLPITEDPDYLWGSATDINDENEVVGFLIRSIQGVQRYVGFKYDIDTDTFMELEGFFNGSSTYPTAINNSGVIVGSAEIEASLSTQRRRVGFSFESAVENARFTNLNDLVDCDANLFIATADGINNNGVITAATINEEELVDGEGETQTEQIAKTVILDPTSGEANQCSVIEDRVERQGAATGFGGLLTMLLIGGLITVRRWLKV